MNRFFLLSFATLGLLLPSCTTAPEIERFHTSGRIDPIDFPDVDAVVLLDRTELLFSFSAESGRPYAQALHTKRIQLLKPSALDLAKVQIPFDDRSTIFFVQTKRIAPDGAVDEMPADRALDMMRFKSGTAAAKLYDGKGYKLDKVSDAKVGDVIEISYVRIYRDPRWVDPIGVGGLLPVVRGEVIVDAPNSFDVDFRVTKLGRLRDVNPTKIPQRVKGPESTGEGVPGSRRVFLFEKERAIYPEPDQPAIDALRTQVHIQLRGYTLGGTNYQGYRTWDDVAAWYRELTKGADAADGSIDALVKELGGAGGKKRDKLRRVQTYLQNVVRDVPTFLNLAALPAHKGSDLIGPKVGDAKDQASLGLALLKKMGVSALPVLVSRAGSYATVPDLATPAPFNHVILAVPAGGRYAFIDPSTPFLPTGRLPGPLQGQRGLLVTPNGAELIDLPEDVPAANRRRLLYDLAMNADGTAAGQIRAELDGLFAQRVREILFADGEDTTKKIRALLQPEDDDGMVWREVLPVGGAKAKDPDSTLRLQIVVAPGEIGTEKNGSVSIAMKRIIGRPFAYLWREARYTPLVIPFRYTEKTKVTVSLPEPLGIDTLPPDRTFKSDRVEYLFQWAVSGGKVLLHRDATVAARRVDTMTYRQLRSSIIEVWQGIDAPLVARAGGFRGTDYGADPF